MIAEPKNYDQKQISRLLGEVRLQLPATFRDSLCKAVDEGLSIHSLAVSNELKDLIIGQVALTLQASDLRYIIEQENERHERSLEAKSKSLDYLKLQALQNKHSDVTKKFEDSVYKRRPYDQVYANFKDVGSRIEFLNKESAEILSAWANSLFGKYKAITGYKGDK